MLLERVPYCCNLYAIYSCNLLFLLFFHCHVLRGLMLEADPQTTSLSLAAVSHRSENPVENVH